MSAAPEWSRETVVEVGAGQIAAYAEVVGEEPADYEGGAPAPPMFAVVYSAPAIWQAVLAEVEFGAMLVHAAQEFEWLAPVLAGDRIATAVRLAEEAPLGGHRGMLFDSVSRNAGGELVSRGRWTIISPEGGL